MSTGVETASVKLPLAVLKLDCVAFAYRYISRSDISIVCLVIKLLPQDIRLFLARMIGLTPQSSPASPYRLKYKCYYRNSCRKLITPITVSYVCIQCYCGARAEAQLTQQTELLNLSSAHRPSRNGSCFNHSTGDGMVG